MSRGTCKFIHFQEEAGEQEEAAGEQGETAQLTTIKQIASKVSALTAGDFESLATDEEVRDAFPEWWASNLWHCKAVKKDILFSRWVRDHLKGYAAADADARRAFLKKATKRMIQSNDTICLFG